MATESVIVESFFPSNVIQIIQHLLMTLATLAGTATAAHHVASPSDC